mmetsp:Transcript_27095/g.30920  ORF Transcript_27095/g.30920 Transcript_27095/m.30920 type:complete len:1030 (-) Transcript_27095:480-3569(-)
MHGAEEDSIDERSDIRSNSDASSSQEPDEGTSKISILCEIVGARHLTAYDDGGTKIDASLRPFCVIKLGERVVHKTKCEVGCNPIWTASSRSLFLLKVTPLEIGRGKVNMILYSKKKRNLAVRVLDPERIFLGQINLDFTKILSHCDEQRLEVDIGDDLGDVDEEGSNLRGKLALRFRIATEFDQKLVKSFQEKCLPKDSFLHPQEGTERPKFAKLITETSKTKVVQSSFMKSVKYVFSPNIVECEKTGAPKVRLKPYPDTNRLNETTFMTAREIRYETLLPSKNWIECGSGNLGKLHVEILSCHDLPNLDVGEAVGNLTDSFVSLVFEDSCAMTEVINDELSPHWLPWTQRAFCFGILHPASILYLGVFDYDLGVGNFDPIGRVAVNVSNFQKNTTYNLKYNLYPSSNVTDRTAVGSIQIRLLIECFDEKAALLEAVKPRPKMHVNAKKERTFKVIRYTCFGEFDNEEKFDFTVVRSYINEIFEYKSNLSYVIGDSIQSLMFWHGQVDFFSFRVPLHSFLFFCSGTILIEHPYMIIPFSLMGVSWIMLANLTIRRQHPSPWHNCPSFWQFLTILRTGESPKPISRIKRFEGSEAAQAYELRQKKRLEDDRKVAEKKADLQQQINTIGNDTIFTQIVPGGIPLEFLNTLGRYQGYMGTVCNFFRFIKIIVTWEESVVSFWITAVFLAAGILTLILPWKFILKWTSRIVVYGFFGPHMKLIDISLRYNNKRERAINKLMENFDVKSHLARLRREEAIKLKDIKAIAFGKFSTLVPSLNLARHYDRPLPESWAKIRRDIVKCKELSLRGIPNKNPYFPGQQLYGTMIPKPQLPKIFLNHESFYRRKLLNILRKSIEKTTIESTIILEQPKLELSSEAEDSNESNLHVPSGYEIIPDGKGCYVELSNSVASFESESSTLLKTTSNKKNTTGIAEISTDSICSTKHENRGNITEDEEGIEIVGLGRYSSWAYDDNENDDGNDNDDYDKGEEEREPVVDCSLDLKRLQPSRLSEMHKSSERVLVAFYRPTESRE